MAIMKYLHIFNWWEKQIIYKVKKSILEDLLKDVKILSSLAIASIDTYEALNNINILGNNKVESLFITVYQYLLRMMSRATPFGTFASLSDAILETTSDQK